MIVEEDKLYKSTNSLNIIKEDPLGEFKIEQEKNTKRKKGYQPKSPPNNLRKPINSPRNTSDNIKRSEDMLDLYYNNLGHDYYTKILKIFEKYCHHGKVNNSIGMDYSQFSTFMQQNNMYEGDINKTNSELIFNKIKGQNKLVGFEDFIRIIIEFSKKEFPWEKDDLRKFKYFFNKRINHFPCLERTYEERNMERFFFFLEYDDYQAQIKKFLPTLKRNFQKYKHSDLRISECISTESFIKMCKDLTIIPVFMSAKEILGVINYVKYHKKNLFPTGNINFCSYIEVLCLIAFQSFDKYSNEDKEKRYIDHIEKLNIFLKFLVDKIK